KKRIIDDHAVPRRTLEPERLIGAQAIRVAEVGLAGSFASQAPRDRQRARIDDGGGEIGPINREHDAEEVAETLAADVKLRGLVANEFAFDAHTALAVLHRITPRIDHEADVAGIDRRFQPSVRG